MSDQEKSDRGKATKKTKGQAQDVRYYCPIAGCFGMNLQKKIERVRFHVGYVHAKKTGLTNAQWKEGLPFDHIWETCTPDEQKAFFIQ